MIEYVDSVINSLVEYAKQEIIKINSLHDFNMMSQAIKKIHKHNDISKDTKAKEELMNICTNTKMN